MDLSRLRENLPAEHDMNLAEADRDLLESFKASALSITTLYKSARTNAKLNYTTGYAACLRDVLAFIQAGVSAEGRMAELGGRDGSGALGVQLLSGEEGMTIGMVMDWLENRLESVVGGEEEEEMQTQGTQQGRRNPSVGLEDKRRRENEVTTTRPGAVRRTSPPSSRGGSRPTPQANYAQPPQPQHRNTTRPPSSSPPLPPLPTVQSKQQPTSSSSRSRRHHHRHTTNAAFTFRPPLPVTAINPFEHDFGTSHLESSDDSGAADGGENDLPSVLAELVATTPTQHSLKRRHSTLLCNASPNGGASSSTRNNGQGTQGGSGKRRGGGHHHGPGLGSGGSGRQALGESQDANNNNNSMDVEEEPVRKRVARR